MKGYFRPALAIALCVLLAASAAMAGVNVKIPAGTSVQVRITEELSSETANVGRIPWKPRGPGRGERQDTVSQGSHRYGRSNER